MIPQPSIFDDKFFEKIKRCMGMGSGLFGFGRVAGPMHTMKSLHYSTTTASSPPPPLTTAKNGALMSKGTLRPVTSCHQSIKKACSWSNALSSSVLVCSVLNSINTPMGSMAHGVPESGVLHVYHRSIMLILAFRFRVIFN